MNAASANKEKCAAPRRPSYGVNSFGSTMPDSMKHGMRKSARIFAGAAIASRPSRPG
jgi:hypothetical protein